MDLSRLNPTGRFSGLADVYSRCRPDYPGAALDAIISFAGLTATSLLVDVGAGTGISARLFAQRGIPVLGIEPNADMRARAEAEQVPPGCPQPQYRDGRAEATGLPGATATAVLAAQAFHWFDAQAAFREFHRILAPGGAVALMWNERDEADPFTAAIGAVMRTEPNAAALESSRGVAGVPLLSCPLFHDAERRTFGHEQALDEDGVLGRALSASYVPKEPAAVEVFVNSLRAIFARFEKNGQALLRYATTLFLARREK
jgi:SAM-dependent methyltransferase